MKRWFSVRQAFRILFFLWGLWNVIFMLISPPPYVGVLAFLEYHQVSISNALIFFYLFWRLGPQAQKDS